MTMAAPPTMALAQGQMTQGRRWCSNSDWIRATIITPKAFTSWTAGVRTWYHRGQTGVSQVVPLAVALGVRTWSKQGGAHCDSTIRTGFRGVRPHSQPGATSHHKP